MKNCLNVQNTCCAELLDAIMAVCMEWLFDITANIVATYFYIDH